MDTPVTALAKEHKTATALRVRVTLRSGALVDGVALDGTDDVLVLAVPATTEPVRIPLDDITAVAVRERNRAREWLVALGAIAAVPALLVVLIQLPFEIPENVFKWIIGAIILAASAAGPRVMRIPLVDRTLHRWREVYRGP